MGNNRIGAISLNFKTSRKEGAWQLQQRLKHLIAHSVIPKLEALFDQIDDGQSLIRIGLLEIDVGRVSRAEVDKELAERVVSQVAARLRGAKTVPPARFVKRQIPVDLAIAEAFAFFLQTGLFPRFCRPVYADFREERIFKALSGHPAILEKLAAAMQTNALPAKRLERQFTAPFVEKVYEMLAPLTVEAAGPPAAAETQTKDKDIESIPHEPARPKQPRPLEATEPVKEEEVTDTDSGKPPQSKKNQPPKETEPEQQEKTDDIFDDFDDFASEGKPRNIYVQNAGLVLLHPFLSGDNEQGFALFEEAGLAKDGQFIDETSRERALHLLQYLAWGREQQPEHEMLLDKILCGLPPNLPVHRFIQLTEKEKGACRQAAHLLSEEWQGVSETSLEALQESFLQRLGKLEPISLGWRLTVEKNTIDILLKRLPYGMGVIRFPWMENMLWVEWDY